jgi:hypothetical protein
LPSSVVADLENPAAVVVVAVSAKDISALADLSELISDVEEEARCDAALRLRGRIPVCINGNKVPLPKTRNRT